MFEKDHMIAVSEGILAASTFPEPLTTMDGGMTVGMGEDGAWIRRLAGLGCDVARPDRLGDDLAKMSDLDAAIFCSPWLWH